MSKPKDFTCVGGLEKHIRILKETIMFPLMYGDVYARFNLRPPRGLLFYGPPGTGKTLVAGALAVECSNSERKVSFISRKGSDCLSKWVGESEKKLQKIFLQAQQTKPCIIFFDEVDGLAPIRSSRQDFVHASVVSTLLALMDGLDNNSEVIVIGATNRLDAIDPALRRPGRFDRELYFPLPCFRARKEILSVHIKSWKQKPAQKFLAYLASKTVGFCGSDLQALCAEAVMCCVRRNYPQIYTSKSKYCINERLIRIEKQDFLKAQQNIVPASHRVAITPVKCLATKVQPLLQDVLAIIMSRLQTICPLGMLTSDNIIGRAASRSSSCPRILLCGDDHCHTRHLGPAILHSLEHLPCHVLDVTTLFEETGRAAEEAIIQKVKAARHTLPSILYVPDILAWWELVEEAARVVFTSLMKGLDSSVFMLVLTTANCSHANVPGEIRVLYDEYQGEVYEIRPPGALERQAFFKQLYHKANSTPDDLSHKSSNTSGVQIGTSKKIKAEGKTRTRLSCIQPNDSTSPATSGLSVKREHSASGERVPSKRQRSLSGANICTPKASVNPERLTEAQVQELLQRTVFLSEDWNTQQLESLNALLEVTIEKNVEDMFISVNECLSTFQETEKFKIRIKKEEDCAASPKMRTVEH